MTSAVIDKLLDGHLPIDFNWNTDPCKGIPIDRIAQLEPTAKQASGIRLISEDLRDGLHGVSEYPSAGNIKKFIDALYRFGIRTMTVGIYPGANKKLDTSIKTILKYLHQTYPAVIPVVLVLANEQSLAWADACKKENPNLTALVFMGTAPSRLLVEEWDESYILEKLGWAIDTAVRKMHIRVTGATEHTTQTPPDFLSKIIATAVTHGATSFCIADTIGIARPQGVHRIVQFVGKTIRALRKGPIGIEWHGHDDMGNSTANALAAISAGATAIHTVASGIGERAGNTRLESVILNCSAICAERGISPPWRITHLSEVLGTYNAITHTAPPQYGPLGIRAFHTSLGIHTAAILKAQKLSDEAKRLGHAKLSARLQTMANTIYCAVDAEAVGRSREIRLGPFSGKSTFELLCRTLELPIETLNEEQINLVLAYTKQIGRELTIEEFKKLLSDHNWY